MEVLSVPKSLGSKENIIPTEMEVDSISSKVQNNQRCHDEYQYLDLITRIIETGKMKGDRTGTALDIII